MNKTQNLNQKIDLKASKKINNLFFEVILAPNFDSTALELLKSKKNRIILKLKNLNLKLISLLLKGPKIKL